MGEPLARPLNPSDGRRGTANDDWKAVAGDSSMGESTKFSRRFGVEAEAGLLNGPPNWNGGSNASLGDVKAVGTVLVEYILLLDNVGLWREGLLGAGA